MGSEVGASGKSVGLRLGMLVGYKVGLIIGFFVGTIVEKQLGR